MTCAAAFARVALDVGDKSASRYDRRIRRFIRAYHDDRLEPVSNVLVGLSAPGLAIAVTIATAFSVRRRGAHVWLPIAISPFVAMTAGRMFTEFLPQQGAPGTDEPCFPSGHTTGLTAEVLTVLYVLSREKMVGGGSFALSLFPVVAGVNRLYRDRHWTSDVIAAWAAGTAVAAGCAILYEQLR